MKKIKLMFIITLLVVSSSVFAKPVGYCSWYSSGCVVYVTQYDSSWTMNVTCNDGSGGYWNGLGEWGGVCH